MNIFDSIVVRESRTEIAVHRALAQVGHALKDFGLFIEVDRNGNYSIGRLPAEYAIKDERVSDRLRRIIHEAYRRDKPATRITINYEQAKRFAAELSDLEFTKATSEAEIYAALVAGECRFLDVPVAVYPE